MANQNSTFLPFGKKFAYGFGNLGNCFIYIVVSSYILIYCTNVVGLAAGIVGTLLMVARILDGITDVFMGSIIDKTRSKAGKARFWYGVSIIPLGICMYLIFSTPASMSSSGQYTWLFILYVLISAVFYTMNTVAYNTMIAMTTNSQKDQVTMSSISMLFGMAGAVVVASVTPTVVEMLGGGSRGYQMMALIYAVIGCVILFVPFFALRELPEGEQGEQRTENSQSTVPAEKVSFLQTLRELLQNKYFIIILLLYMIGYMTTGINSTIGVYFATYQLGNANLLGILSLPSTIAMVIGIVFIPAIIAKAGMWKANVAGAIIMTIGSIVSAVGYKFGLIPLMLGFFIKGIGMVPGSASYSPLMAKTAEYNYLKTGHRITGSIFSCASVGTKIGTGLGTAICGWLLDAAAFDGTAAVQSAQANTTIVFLYLTLPAILSALTIVLRAAMDVDAKVEKMQIQA